MKRKRFSETQIVQILKEAEAGVAVPDLCRRHGFSKSSYYKWKARYSSMEVSDLKRLSKMKAATRRLKPKYVELSLEHQAHKDIIEKKM